MNIFSSPSKKGLDKMSSQQIMKFSKAYGVTHQCPKCHERKAQNLHYFEHISTGHINFAMSCGKCESQYKIQVLWLESRLMVDFAYVE